MKEMEINNIHENEHEEEIPKRRGNRGNGGYSGVEDGVKERNKRLECEMMMQKSENGN